MFDLKDFFRLALPSVVLMYLDWSVYELIQLCSGYISVYAAGACVIIINILFFINSSTWAGNLTLQVLVG